MSKTRVSEIRIHPAYGLTLKQPWAWCVSAGHKRIENRGWKPWSTIVGHPVAIHAGTAVDPAAWKILSERHHLLPVRDALPRGVIVAVATVTGYVIESDDPWFMGPYGWLLEDVVAIPPVPCKGSLGLWRMPGPVRRIVTERYLAYRPRLH